MGEIFGTFELLGLLNSGGMGEVYRARRLGGHRVEALKRLSAHLSRDDQFVRRFQRECELSAQLEHPHIVPVYDHGVIDDQLFMTMRLIKGEDLGEHLKRGPLDPFSAVDVVAQVADALDYAHSKQVEHRDIKPSNIMLTESLDPAKPPFVYVLDFGIARSYGASPLTQAHSVLGTTAYMAPERFLGEPSDHRADVYSLACVLFESLTGAAPFARYANGVDGSIAYAHIHAEIPRPSELESSVPKALDEVVAKGMAKAPEDRFVTAGELAGAARQAVATTDAKPMLGPTERLPSRGKTGSEREEERPGGASGGARKGSSSATSRNPWRRLRGVVVVATLAVAAVVVAAVLVTRDNGSARSGLTTSPPISRAAVGNTAQGPLQQSNSASEARVAAAGIAPGVCLDETSRAVSCDISHSVEVYATGATCTHDDLVRYLGGVSGTDTLLPTVTASASVVSGVRACVVHGPAAGASSGSARNVLSGPAGDSWRYCFTLPNDVPTGCNRAHDGEYVYSAPVASGQSINCSDKASAYLGLAFDQVSSELAARRADAGNVLACAVVLRVGGDVLVASVHDLGQNVLPIQPR